MSPSRIQIEGVEKSFAVDGHSMPALLEVNLEIQGKNSDANDLFWDRLEKTGSFHNIQWSAVDVTEEGLHKIRMTADYTPVPGGVGR